MSSGTIIGAGAPSARTVRLGTRGSALAVAQSSQVARAIVAASRQIGTDLQVELIPIRTRGDVDSTPLTRLGGVGVFAAALREALLDGSCDLAVHSCKDLPTTPVPGLHIAAIPPREDPRDALCTAGGVGLADLPPGARVGTGSPRRAAQLLAVRPDLQVVPVRGNVPTRLSRVVGSVVGADGPLGAVREPDLDAVVLALAGLRRLGLDNYATQPLALPQDGPRAGTPGRDQSAQDASPAAAARTPVMVPAPAQGALALETRSTAGTEQDRPVGRPGADTSPRAGVAPRDPGLAAALAATVSALDDPLTHAAVTAERALMRHLEAGCAAPVGAVAVPTTLPEGHTGLRLDAVVATADGRSVLRESVTGTRADASALGEAVAQALLEAGAADLVDLHAALPGRGRREAP
ncbi:hydroxymethylbilane synthase [Actinomyces sp. 565]|uniref:hydroxymethylbilane synthase n=1 Tax=Actinomyces sp. 565 TaxID=2057794 RepID=UPI0013A6E0D7|nr:hydroxymethylbilane synthase [Actinomyces sp. 565]NDR52999.1 hydroxymethylbilane synthase [Actinomyces sp. 565]